mmetsp:Transcript_22092/g.33386  ORF Transcript_22092/g.33386 Transcript_22092/m.33386 type:complete len:308 (+) Transcript_22092:201-1124(+)
MLARRVFPFRQTRRCFHQSRIASNHEGKTVLVLGSSGALGGTISNHLSSLGAKVIGADIVEGSTFLPGGFVPLPHPGPHPTLAETTHRLTEGVGSILRDTDDSLNAVIVTSGGWEGDPPMTNFTVDDGDYDDYLEKNTALYGESIERMIRMNLYPVLAAGHVVQQFIRDEDGLFVIMGAVAALNPTPGMLGYGIAKTAAHQYIQSYALLTESAVTTQTQRNNTKSLRKATPSSFDSLTVVGILPTVLDTPANREAMPDADFTKWAPVQDIASEIGIWMEKPFLRPHSGSLIKVIVRKPNGTKFQLVR